LFTEEVLRFIRRSIRKNEGILIDPEDLAKAIHEMLSTEARERIGPVRVRRKRKTRTTNQSQDEPEPTSGEESDGDSKPPEEA
jgi:hypothetical protein